MLNINALIQNLGRSLLQIESRILQAAGLDRHLTPALALNGPSLLPQQQEDQEMDDQQDPSFLDSILWMAVPKKRRTIEINRTRRRSDSKVLKVKHNVEQCVECGHLKQKHVLCAFCYRKVCRETSQIRHQIYAMEGPGLRRAPAVETVVLYEGETPSEKDQDKRIVERPRKRPAWFS
ncbi:large ribosomal subunit protein bL32m isoform X2 [Genypterus blacodes]|uniref:large ribosomal subunit protein bL32m isoform X2 n=1 Tax=Genypterus blacodes TaxID=154954 RepID=UPI003F75E326